jgi:hypothetical protein
VNWPPKFVAFFAMAATLVVLPCGPMRAAQPDDLYEAHATVTGQGVMNRMLGVAACLTEVLVKVSGDPRLADNPWVAAMGPTAGAWVRDFHYRDLMAGKPVRDEQGTRDRPYDLTVRFDPAKIDDALRSLDSAPWTGARPRLVVFVSVSNGSQAWLLAADGARGQAEREALAAAGARRGLSVVLPDEASLAALHLDYAGLQHADLSRLDAAARTTGGDVALAGRMEWRDAALVWSGTWRLAHGTVHRWRLRRVTFDDLFRDTLGGAAQILSGHGRPR